jgi:Kef-type K+ transport system membrane component KefB
MATAGRSSRSRHAASTKVAAGSCLTIVLVGAIAAVTVSALPKRYAPPVVVLEIVLGIIVGPQVLGLAQVDKFVTFFSNLGLGMLFFFAGYEIDFDRIRGNR